MNFTSLLISTLTHKKFGQPKYKKCTVLTKRYKRRYKKRNYYIIWWYSKQTLLGWHHLPLLAIVRSDKTIDGHVVCRYMVGVTRHEWMSTRNPRSSHPSSSNSSPASPCLTSAYISGPCPIPSDKSLLSLYFAEWSFDVFWSYCCGYIAYIGCWPIVLKGTPQLAG